MRGRGAAAARSSTGRSGDCEASSLGASSAAPPRPRPTEHARVVETAVIDTAPLIAYLGGVRRALGRAARRVLRDAEGGRVRLAVPTLCLFEVGAARTSFMGDGTP